jgi:hypothetical protein
LRYTPKKKSPNIGVIKTLHRLIADFRLTGSSVAPRISFLFLFLGAGFAFAQLCSGAPFQFEATSSLVAARYGHTATLLVSAYWSAFSRNPAGFGR